MQKNILTVFIGSPGDLSDERTAIREEIDEINKTVGEHLGWLIDLRGWEDTSPGYARPQEKINRDVDACDLFVGMLWRRWGQSTGQYSSGFEEEFERAKRRRTDSASSPEIWLMFKKVSAEHSADPGEQLKRVLAFKKEQEEKKELLYKVFEDTTDFRKLIRRYLLEHLFSCNANLSLSQAEVSPPTKPDSLPAAMSQLESKVADGELTEDVVQLFNKIGHSLLQGGLSSIDIVDRTRLFLVATAWFSQEHAGETLSVHEANLIYKQRLTWKLSESELTVVFRSILADTASLLPGWYWLRDFDENDVNELLWNFALDDSAPAVRAGATNLLAKIGKYSNLDSLKSLLNDPITAPNAVELARQAKDSRAIPLLNSLLTDKNSSVSKGAFNAIIEIQIGTDPAEAFERLVAEGRSLPPFLSDIGEDDLLPVDAGTIADALKRAATPIRRFAIDYLIKRELLTRDAAKELLSDPEPSIRKRAVIYLDRLGERFTREEISNLFPEANHQQGGSAGLASFGINSIRASDFLPIILANESNEQLEQQANAFSSSGAIAYGIRAKRDFNQLGPLLREDLAGEFRKLEEAWARSFQARSGAPMTEVWPEDLRDFVRNRYISEAFSVLADNASVGDLDIARKYLQSGNIADSIAAPLISIFRKFGSSRDAENLVEFSRTATEGRAKRLAIDAALLLSDEGTKLASTFLENDDQVVRNSAVRYLKRQEWPKIADVVNEMLLSEHDNIRLVGAALIIKNYDSDQLESLLRSYLGNEVYYYDVVTYVDRAIHSPPQIRDIYRIDITGALN